MPTQAQIARDWSVSRVYVTKCVKRGCPTDSFENARLWRDAHARQRPPTNPKQLEQLDDQNGAKVTGGVTPSNTMEQTLQKSILAADEAFRLLQEAMLEGKDSKISIRLGVHNKAVEQRIKAETMIREEKERQRILIPLNEAQEMARKGFGMIMQRLAILPQNLAPRVNPHDPHHALEILETECRIIIQEVQNAYAS